MARWQNVVDQEPEFAARAERFLAAHKHLTLATLRRDGSPRISGTEIEIAHGDVWLGSMWESRKALDLRRDPRFALHSGSDDPPQWEGDAKLSGRVEEIDDAAIVARVYEGKEETPSKFHLFRCELEEVAVVRLNEARDKLVIESWREGRGLRRADRA